MLAYAAATPPFQGPDEVGHFWRSYSLARGTLMPAREHGKPVALVPRGVRDLVATLWVDTAGRPDAKIGVERLRAAWRVPLAPQELVSVGAPAHYTPVPYIPQTLACFIGDRLHLRPLLTFYLGRLFNVAATLALFVLAVRMAKQRWAFIAIALLPMLLYLCGTFSADATTSGLAFVVTAMALDGDDRRWPLFVVCAFLLALCKPAYFLLPLLRVFRLTRVRIAVLTIVVAAGVWIASANATRNFSIMRTDVPTGPQAQMVNVRLAPLTFLRIAASDYRKNGFAYAEHFVGRLGWLDIPLPRPLVIAALVLLLLVGLTSERLRARERLLGIAIVIASMLLISLSQYLAWSPIGADYIEGIQGRYFLPLGPLVLLLFSAGPRNARVATAVRAAFVVTAIALNAIGVFAIVQRYW